jgi:hypothetical protein
MAREAGSRTGAAGVGAGKSPAQRESPGPIDNAAP